MPASPRPRERITLPSSPQLPPLPTPHSPSQVLTKTACAHRAPDGFRGRGNLTACLLLLQAVLAAAPASRPIHPPAPLVARHEGYADRPGGSPGSPAEIIEGIKGSVLYGPGEALRRGRGRVVGGTEGFSLLAGLSRLACHRDAAVRALAFAVMAEFQAGEGVPPGRGDRGGEDRGSEDGARPAGGVGGGGGGVHGEAVEACVRAAGDGLHETPAVREEALRLLCRWVLLAFSLSRSLPGLCCSHLSEAVKCGRGRNTWIRLGVHPG